MNIRYSDNIDQKKLYTQSILILIPNDILGGAELYLKNVAYFFLDSDYEVNVVFFKKKYTAAWSDIEARGAKLYFSKVNKEKFAGFHVLKYVYWLSKRSKIEYAFSSHTHTNGILGFLRKIKILKTKYLIVRESTLIFQRFTGYKLSRFKFFYRLGYDETDMVICQTKRMAEHLKSSFRNLPKWNIVTIPNPILLDDINIKALEEVNPSPYEFGEYIIAAGRLIKLKGFDILIKSFALLEYPRILNLVVLGTGPELANLNELSFELGLQKRIFLIGHVTNPIPYFKKAKVCVVSSLIEGFPNVLLQMLSQNNKVVSTNCAGDIHKLPGVTICDPGGVQGLSQAIQDVLHKNTDDPKLRNLIDRCLQQRSIEEFFKEVLVNLKVNEKYISSF